MISRNYISFFTVSLSLVCLFCMSCRRSEFRRASGLIWNTSYHITYASGKDLNDSVIATLDEIGKSLNVFDSTSLVSRVNKSTSMVIDRHFRKVYEASEKVCSASEGMFDPTVSPLISAWGFGPGDSENIDSLKIASILEYVGLSKTHLRGDTLIKGNRAICFNFSAVAKGYACDEVAEMLRRNEVTDYLVEIGGEIAMGGVSPGKDIWKISIDAPIVSDSAVIHDSSAIIRLTDAGMATSGNYRNFRTQNGKTFGHTISPKSGMPVATDVISATVIAPSAMEADAAATACMAAGSEAAKKIVSYLGYDCLLILADSTIWTTPGLSDAMVR